MNETMWYMDVEQRSVSSNLAKARILISFVCVIVACALAAVAAWFGLVNMGILRGMALACIGIFFLIGLIWLLWLIPRQVRALKWAVTDTDLYICRGIMFVSMTVVPLERLQYVEISQGPVARLFGLASVELHTASASSDASIPGLKPDVAADLRQRLSAHSGVELSGI